MRFASTAPDAFRMLSGGESYLMIHGNDGAAGPLVLAGAPIRAVDMRDGMVFTGASVAAFSGGPHPNATLLLLNWLLGPEGQTVYGKTRGVRMVRSDLPDFRPSGSWVKMANPVFVTLEYANKADQLYRERWFNKLVGR